MSVPPRSPRPLLRRIRFAGAGAVLIALGAGSGCVVSQKSQYVRHLTTLVSQSPPSDGARAARRDNAALGALPSGKNADQQPH